MCRNANPDKNSRRTAVNVPRRSVELTADAVGGFPRRRSTVKVPRRSVERTVDAVEGSSDAVERHADAVERHVDAVDAALKPADAVETRSTPVVAAVVSSLSVLLGCLTVAADAISA